ncbi:MAG: 3-keto-5-aminohexanoate cleavage protein [Verrucomicrobiota bacterium]
MNPTPLIINAAITGMVPTHKDNPHVPLSPAEIVADARRCRDAGASILHVHARDDAGAPTCHREIFAEIIGGIRSACPGLLISGTTSGRCHKEFEQRSQVLELDGDLRPDFASLTLGSMNFPTQASVNEPRMIQDLARRMRQRGIVPELELFDLGMTDYAKYLVDRQILEPPFYANILLGSLGTLAATPQHLALMVDGLPEGTTWSAAGIGRYQWPMNQLAIAMGGHVRVGLEDNLWMDTARTDPASNPRLVERLVKLAGQMGRPIASPETARDIIGLRPRTPHPESVSASPPTPDSR